jgi:hypothetical protein
MAFYRVVGGRGAASFKVIIHDLDGGTRTIVGFRDREEIANWLSHQARRARERPLPLQDADATQD